MKTTLTLHTHTVMNLRLIKIIKTEHKVPSSKDRRRKVTRVTASYYGDDGHEYRKSFEKSAGLPIVPEYGSNEEITGKRYQ